VRPPAVACQPPAEFLSTFQIVGGFFLSAWVVSTLDGLGNQPLVVLDTRR